MKKSIIVHCGNSPKMERVIDLVVALAAQDGKSARMYVGKDFIWSDISGQEILHYENMDKVLLSRPKVTSLQVTNALSHGNGAMCEGVMEFVDHDELYFCAVVQFTSTASAATIKKLHIYYVKK